MWEHFTNESKETHIKVILIFLVVLVIIILVLIVLVQEHLIVDIVEEAFKLILQLLFEEFTLAVVVISL